MRIQFILLNKQYLDLNLGLDTARKNQEIDDDDKEDDVITKVREEKKYIHPSVYPITASVPTFTLLLTRTQLFFHIIIESLIRLLYDCLTV